jgi:hypothetical protein
MTIARSDLSDGIYPGHLPGALSAQGLPSSLPGGFARVSLA